MGEASLKLGREKSRREWGRATIKVGLRLAKRGGGGQEAASGLAS